MPVSPARKRARRKVFQPQRAPKPSRASGIRVVFDGRIQELSDNFFPGGSTHPRNDPLLKRHVKAPDPLSPKFEAFRGRQAAHLPKGVWLWEKATVSELVEARARVSKTAKEKLGKLNELTGKMSWRKMLVLPRLAKKKMSALSTQIETARREHEEAKEELKAIDGWMKVAHGEKLSELRKAKNPNLP